MIIFLSVCVPQLFKHVLCYNWLFPFALELEIVFLGQVQGFWFWISGFWVLDLKVYEFLGPWFFFLFLGGRYGDVHLRWPRRFCIYRCLGGLKSFGSAVFWSKGFWIQGSFWSKVFWVSDLWVLGYLDFGSMIFKL